MKNQFENYVVLYKITEQNGRSFMVSGFIFDLNDSEMRGDRRARRAILADHERDMSRHLEI